MKIQPKPSVPYKASTFRNEEDEAELKLENKLKVQKKLQSLRSKLTIGLSQEQESSSNVTRNDESNPLFLSLESQPKAYPSLTEPDD